MSKVCLLDWETRSTCYQLDADGGRLLHVGSCCGEQVVQGLVEIYRKDFACIYFCCGSLNLQFNENRWKLTFGNSSLSYSRFLFLEHIKITDGANVVFKKTLIANKTVFGCLVSDPTFDCIDEMDVFFFQWVSTVTKNKELFERILLSWSRGQV